MKGIRSPTKLKHKGQAYGMFYAFVLYKIHQLRRKEMTKTAWWKLAGSKKDTSHFSFRVLYKTRN